tara:strand:- start:3384 stop:5150 length:1767 start_codon:yes stop_codon:yes gene_type:complete
MATAIDFETYYSKDYSVRTLGNQGYVAHEEFDPYMVSLVNPERGISFVGHPKDAPWNKLPDAPHFVAHNAGFDSTVFKGCQNKGLIPERFYPKWDCSANLSVYIQAPRSLAGVAEQMFGQLPDKSVRDNMKGRTLADLTEQESKDLHDYALKDSELCLKVWDQYRSYWPKEERVIARHTMESGQRGVAINTQYLWEGLQALNAKKHEAEKLIPWSEDSPPTSAKCLAAFCEAEGIRSPKSTALGNEDCEAWEKEFSERYPVIGAIRDWRSANRLVRFLELVGQRQNGTNSLIEPGLLPFNLKYFGATLTGRWSGDAKINLQNIPRGETFGVDVRKMFVPRNGKKFIIADLAQIEPRCLAWTCGDTQLLDYVKQGKDIYEAHALSTMGVKRVTKATRQLAKIRVLGLGYGCGPSKFAKIAENWGIEMSEAEARRIVRSYRKDNPKIINFWNQCEKDFIANVGQDHRYRLPSGRWISYFDVFSQGGRFEGHLNYLASITRGDKPRSFYGGKICENIIQATARDVFADSYYRILKAGFNIIWTVHDEFIVEVDENDNDARQEIERLMSITPEWLEGCPIGAEAIEAKQYTK